MDSGDLSRLKQQMLRQAVQHNVEIREGGPPKSLRPGRRRVKRSIRIAAMVVVPIVLFASVNAISTGATRPEVIVVGQEAAGLDAASPDPKARFTRPQALSPSVFRLGVRTIIVDAGHGGSDPGARTATGLLEKEITLDVARRLRDLLEGGGFKVLMTRSGDESVSLKDRAAFANGWRGDLFVSIHVNSLPSARRGIETYFVGDTDDPEVQALASEENRTSGYSLSDFRRLFEGVYRDVRQSESRKLAVSVQQTLYSSLRKGTPDLQDRGVKSAPFVVLIATDMPGILAEVSTVSNDAEAHLLADAVYRQNIARALFAGVHSYAESRNRGNPGSDGGSRPALTASGNEGS